MHSRHLTVDLVALGGGEISWYWEDNFRVAAAMQASARELGVPVRWGGCWGTLFTIETPEDGFADYGAACRARGRRPFLDGPALRAAQGEYPA